MYSDDDLEWAVKQKIFSSTSVVDFKTAIQARTPSVSADEEPFKLVSSFNDIFVVIASLLVLFSSKWILSSFNSSLAFGAFIVLAWYLSEVFVARKKMALPAIVLLLSFVGGSFYLGLSFFTLESQSSYFIASALAVLAAYLHWRKFRVPITIAAGAAALILCIASSLLMVFDKNITLLMWSLCICGVFTFALAMYWDSSDLTRDSYRSDVAFWLHLLSAPLIIHPIFTQLGIFSGNESLIAMLIVLALYFLMAIISISIDRRAFMVSALVYVIYTVSTFLNNYQLESISVAITGVIIGGLLLGLSIFWGKVRQQVIGLLPGSVRSYLPAIKSS